jgi:hypothetical protein
VHYIIFIEVLFREPVLLPSSGKVGYLIWLSLYIELLTVTVDHFYCIFVFQKVLACIIFNFLHVCFYLILYGCVTWSLTLREERRVRLLENGVLRRVFGPKRDEVTREWRKLHKQELQ